ncbi:MAG: pitrilysin family protein [Melioribacteraceae bacterium]|jgi:zinc protease|nr:pitrilysin family protein [Melioribacteraceae bacterium]
MNDILNIKYEKHILENGLEVVLYQDKSLPIVSVNLWYKVGSANETNGKTGFAHLFEHMMFQGSMNVPKEKHFKFIEEAGGNLNGSTSFDGTNYYETVPANSLELALWLESDRMGFLLEALTQDKLDNQKDVVMNERRQRYDNQPYGLSWEIIFSNLFPENHPYHWPTIGWMKDIEKFELNDVRSFFKTYYSPNNASLVIGGDIEYASTLELVKKYFDEIPTGEPIPKISIPKAELTENKKIIHQDNVQLSKLYLTWETAKLYDTDDATLDVLSDILTGSKNGRLFKSLVFDKQIAQDISTFQYSANLTGMFIVIATAKPGVDLEVLKTEILLELKKVMDDGITEKELKRSINTVKSSFIYTLQNLNSIVNQINNYNTNLGEPNSLNYDLGRFQKLNSKEIKDVANKYLSNNFVELQIVPKENNNEN